MPVDRSTYSLTSCSISGVAGVSPQIDATITGVMTSSQPCRKTEIVPSKSNKAC